MSRPWFGIVSTGVLCFFSLPIFATSLLIAGVGTATDYFAVPIRRRRRCAERAVKSTRKITEFSFERAIEAYEELIDSYTWRKT